MVSIGHKGKWQGTVYHGTQPVHIGYFETEAAARASCAKRGGVKVVDVRPLKKQQEEPQRGRFRGVSAEQAAVAAAEEEEQQQFSTKRQRASANGQSQTVLHPDKKKRRQPAWQPKQQQTARLPSWCCMCTILVI